MARVLIIEDDSQIRTLLSTSLSAEGHDVHPVVDGMSGLQEAINEAPDVIILDLGLPDLDGLEVLRMVRAVSDVPIMVATARDDTHDLVSALDAGADEYVVKPFSGREMQARVRAILRRGQAPTILDVGELQIDLSSRVVRLRGNEIELRRKEFEILRALAERPGEVVTREELFAAVWRQPGAGTDKTIDVHMSWLRQKLGERAAEPRYIHTVRGVGYRLISP